MIVFLRSEPFCCWTYDWISLDLCNACPCSKSRSVGGEKKRSDAALEQMGPFLLGPRTTRAKCGCTYERAMQRVLMFDG